MTDPIHWVTAPGGVARRRWRLVVENGPDEGRKADLTEPTVLIGAAPASVMALRDDTVSRYHAELDVMTAGLRIRDLRSTNGTYLAHREGAVDEGFLWAGGRFRLGETWLRIEAIDEIVAFSDAPESVQLGGLVGRSVQMQHVFRLAQRLGNSSGPVLIAGPLGVGRAAIARQMHRLSGRADRPLLTVDGENDSVNELFAAGERALLRRADQGTLLLRNVDRLPRTMQVDLRETIERGTLRPDDAQRLDIRWLATCISPRDVEPSLRRHLAVAQIDIPPLEDRREELVPLAEHFLRGAGWKQIRLGAHTRRQLAEVDWPDQVAGLSRLVQRLPLAPDTADDALPGLPDVREAFLIDLLLHHEGNVSRAAVDLAVPTRQLFRTLHRYDVDVDLP